MMVNSASDLLQRRPHAPPPTAHVQRFWSQPVLHYDDTESTNPYLCRSFRMRGLMMKLRNSSATVRDAFRQVHTTACPNCTGVCLPARASSMMPTCPQLIASTR